MTWIETRSHVRQDVIGIIGCLDLENANSPQLSNSAGYSTGIRSPGFASKINLIHLFLRLDPVSTKEQNPIALAAASDASGV